MFVVVVVVVVGAVSAARERRVKITGNTRRGRRIERGFDAVNRDFPVFSRRRGGERYRERERGRETNRQER